MTSQKTPRIRDELLEIINWIYQYSGVKFIWQKFNPPKEPKPVPTGFIWVIGIYVAFFSVASQRYENRIDIIENRANSIFAQLAVPSVQKKALSRIARVQNRPCPDKPDILKPHSVFISLFRDSKYEEMVEQLKETVEDWKGSLDTVDLREAHLNGADLRKASLRGAILDEANLENARLEEANLEKASLWAASLWAANLWAANLKGANLSGADLSGADLRGVEFEDAKLMGANLSGANLSGAKLSGVDLGDINLQRAKLIGTDLRKADLRGANLEKAILWDVYLIGAELTGADFWKTDFWGASLWEEKGLTIEQLCRAESFSRNSLEEELETQIDEKCPNVFNKPLWAP